ncbi:MAG TPA: GNAT family N-acetyltransferase [Candidatus Nanopelagicales bacterium]|nr:GNAT family N-acetyltransferase [Candidatus Nanopelagicales bacterium]
MTPPYTSPRLLEPDHSLDGFTCRSPEQTEWLRLHARQAHSVGTTKVLVVTAGGDPSVVAYYAWSMASIQTSAAPSRVLKGAGRYPQPVALLARLAVATDHEQRGLGAALVADAVRRTAELGSRIGCRGLLVHAESPSARDFYLHLLPEFEASPTDELHLMLLMKDILQTLKG